MPQFGQAKCGSLGWWHCGHSTVVTGLNFQFAARRLRVFERGVFHFGFAMIAFHFGTVASTAHIFASSARRAKSATVFSAPEPQRERADHQLADQITYVETRAAQYVVLTEGIARSARRIEAFFDVDPQWKRHRLQTPIAITSNSYLDGTVDLQPAIDSSQIQPNRCGVGESERIEGWNFNGLVE
jgi:hypothetical protein